MENYNLNYETLETKTLSGSKTFLANVFAWMSFALVITAVLAFFIGGNDERMASLVQMVVNMETGKMNLFGWVLMLAPLGFVLTMSFAFQRLSFPLLVAFFLGYAAVNGVSLSFIFAIYTKGSIATTFIAASAMFGVMAIVGYTTSTDLTSFGRLMMMGLVGILIASLINYFLESDTMDYIISTIGVLVFTGLTAYDVQKLKRIGAGVEFGAQSHSKLAIMGALNLYLDFINLFLMLLRLFGSRRD